MPNLRKQIYVSSRFTGALCSNERTNERSWLYVGFIREHDNSILVPIRYIPGEKLVRAQTSPNDDSHSPLSENNAGDLRDRASDSHSNSEGHFRGMNGPPWKPQIPSFSCDRTESTVMIRLRRWYAFVDRPTGRPTECNLGVRAFQLPRDALPALCRNNWGFRELLTNYG